MRRSHFGSPWLMLTPAISLISVFILVPIVLTVWLSFHDWSTQTGFGAARFVGLRNYEDLFGPISVGRDFRRAFLNTAVYTVLSVVIILPLSVLFGLLVHQTRVAGGQVLRTILFSTYMVPMIAVALVWSKLYSPTEGPINQILSWIGIGPQPWLSSPDTALFSLVILNVWQQIGYFTVLVIAGLTQIPLSLYEAARIDGANRMQEFFGITLPLLRRTLLFSSVIAVINAVQVFEPVVLITQGGPANSTNVLTFHIRRVGIERAQGGLGSAMAVMLMLSLIVIIVLIFAMARQKEER
ncbi:sugar ABC transporter permease [Chelativorans sp. SCAU2101]|jgi:ABC-type sugar transport systems, permease components|uniref:Sugar ABC transporter permease n=1 Tax=Chelativorans petroleitrophicus TaxID=2975484 RepID=A0A9X2X9B9_9HYPH|nr:sugar ABC transporter permease [Chelativorans petroleitrophicus]MCT8991108.1 sugar ABC transporter permease [Chelativorans petroleitrophicus]